MSIWGVIGKLWNVPIYLVTYSTEFSSSSVMKRHTRASLELFCYDSCRHWVLRLYFPGLPGRSARPSLFDVGFR
jgi:hypothetical protein